MKKTFIVSTIFALINLLLMVLVIYPQFSKIQKSSEELISTKKTLLTLESKIKNLEQSKEIYQGLIPNLERMESLFVDSEVPIDFIHFLEKTAAESEVSINVFPGYQQKITADPWPSMGFKASLLGPLSNCLRFLEKLETAPYLIEVQNFTAQRLDEPEGNGEVDLSIKVFTQ